MLVEVRIEIEIEGGGTVNSHRPALIAWKSDKLVGDNPLFWVAEVQKVLDDAALKAAQGLAVYARPIRKGQ